jgi:hypothetical protein
LRTFEPNGYKKPGRDLLSRRMVNRIFGHPASQLRERHEGSDFDAMKQNSVPAAG